MAKTIKIITAFFKVAVKNTFVYRGMVILWMLGWLASFLTMVFLWQSAEKHGSIAGFTQEQIITYYFVGLLVRALCGWFPFGEITESIRDGTIINTILKPVDFHWHHVGMEIGWHTINAIFYILFCGFIFLFVKDSIVFDLNFWTILLFAASLMVAALVTFEFDLLMSTSAFWIINTWGVSSLYWLVMVLLGGNIVPLAFFPKNLQTTVYLLPFRFMYSFPIEIYLGTLNNQQLAFSFLMGIFWILVFYLLFKYFWKKGLRVYTSFGQ